MNDPNHPLWRILTLVVCFAFVVIIILSNATNISADERQEIIWAALAIAGSGAAYEVGRKIFGKNDSSK